MNENKNEIELNKMLEAIESFNEHLYESTTIFLMNPYDIMSLDMNNFNNHVWFVSEINAKRGTCYKVENEFKRTLYDFFEEHPDKMWRGAREL